MKQKNKDMKTYTLVKSYKNGRTDYYPLLVTNEIEAIKYVKKRFKDAFLQGTIILRSEGPAHLISSNPQTVKYL